MKSRIPHVIHRVWLGGEEPDWTKPFAATWERPGWELQRWDDDGVTELFPLANQDLYDEADAIAGDHAGQFKSDILRYEILNEFGGVYVDTDFECLRSIDPLLPGVQFFAAWETQNQWVNNAIMGSAPNHPVLGKLISRLQANVEEKLGERPNVLSGPQYLTPILLEHRRAQVSHGSTMDTTVFGKDLFYPYLWNELDQGGKRFKDAFAVHHWRNMRRRRGVGPPS